MSEKNARRNFLKLSLLGIASGLVAKDVFAQAPPAGKVEMLKEDDPQAKALGYVTDAKKTDLKKFPKRAGKEGEKQYCYNCQFYLGGKDPKSTKSAPCQILQMKGVTAKGWCNTWTQNPAVKD